MESASQTLIDERGYIFMFPKLGLPDPSNPNGEDVVIRAAIGTSKNVSLVNTDAFEAPRRYAEPGLHEPFDIEYGGAVWLLPFLNPQQPSTESELFIVKVKRVHPSYVPNPQRIKLPDNRRILLMKPPPGMFPWQAGERVAPQLAKPQLTEESEETWWKSGVMDHLWGDSRLRKPKSEYHGQFGVYTFRIDPQSNTPTSASEGRLRPHDGIDERWREGMGALAFIERVKATGVLPRNDPYLWLRGVSDQGIMRVDYAYSWCNGRGHQPSEDQWKTVPSEGYKAGCELAMTNDMRRSLGLKELTQEELDSAREAKRATR